MVPVYYPVGPLKGRAELKSLLHLATFSIPYTVYDATKSYATKSDRVYWAKDD